MEPANEVLHIDGSMGEGGGQLYRTTIALAYLLNRDIEIVKIRAGREKGGLGNQHLTCIKMLQEMIALPPKVLGDQLRSQTLQINKSSDQRSPVASEEIHVK